jgi:peptidoglycan/LPS O-acetylase OafA/YrhL
LILPAKDVTWGYAVVALACMTILFCILQQDGRAPLWSAWPPLVYLGKISYGLYVYHLLAIGLALRLLGEHTKSWIGFAGY